MASSLRTPLLICALWALVLSACTGGNQRVRPEEAEASDFHYQLSIGFWQAHEVPGAIRELNTALELNPNNRQALFMLGFIYQGRRNYAEAERLYQRALEVNPEAWDVMNNLGTVYLELRRWEEAERLYDRLTAVPTYTTPGHAWNNLGWAQYNQRRYSEALEAFRMAIDFQPEHCLAYNNLGLTYEELNNPRLAAQAYDDAIRRCSDYQEPYYRLGALLLRLGRDEERAYSLLRDCVRLGADSSVGMRCDEYVGADPW